MLLQHRWFFALELSLAMRGQGQSLLKGDYAHYPVCFVSAFLPTLAKLLLPSKFSGFVGHGLVKGCCFFEFVGQVVGKAYFWSKRDMLVR